MCATRKELKTYNAILKIKIYLYLDSSDELN